MIEFKIDDFLNNCKRKGLSKKTIASYEQTLPLFQVYLKEHHNVSELKKLKFTMFEEYLDYLKSRGKYTVVSDIRSKVINLPENRSDFNK